MLAVATTSSCELILEETTALRVMTVGSGSTVVVPTRPRSVRVKDYWLSSKVGVVAVMDAGGAASAWSYYRK